MKKVLLALLTIASLAVVTDASAWRNRGYGYENGNCGRSCGRSCAPRCAKSCDDSCNPPVQITRTHEKPCGPAPCCLTAVQVPANLVKHVEYTWECPTGCTVQSGETY